MTRRGWGEDSIYQEGDRWRGLLNMGTGPDGRRIRKKVTGRTRAEVAKKLRELRRELEFGVDQQDDRLTVGAFLDRWVGGLDGQISATTQDSYADTVRLHLKPAIGNARLRALTVREVDALWLAKRKAGYSPNSIRIMRSTLRRAIAQAEREGLVMRNVAALSAPQKLNPKEGRSLTVDQAKDLLAAIHSHRYGLPITMALVFGLRRGEVLGLHWSGLDLDKATLRVTHSVKRVKDRTRPGNHTTIEVGDLKTRRSRRTLFLTPQLTLQLRAHRIKQAQEQLTAGKAWKDHGLIFPTEVGTPVDPDNFSHTFSRLAKQAGLGHWHAHELRHSGASLMLAQGTDLYVVSEVLGHASIAITKDVYGHLVEGHKRAASEAIYGALFDEKDSSDGDIA